MRIMGLDYGSKTVGVALSDTLLLTAWGHSIIRREEENKLRKTLRELEGIILEYEVDEIVLGLPKNMDDTEGERVALTADFKEKLERRTGLPVTFWDERLTSVEAENIMTEAGISRKHWKEHVDKIAAMLILQDYLDWKRTSKDEQNGKGYL